MKLATASTFISTFKGLDFVYRPGKNYIIPDALSRLHLTIPENDYANDLEDVVAPSIYYVSLVEMLDIFKERIRQGYADDPSSEPLRVDSSEPLRIDSSEPPRNGSSKPPRYSSSEPPRIDSSEPPRNDSSKPPYNSSSEPPRESFSKPPGNNPTPLGLE
ncbi:hypothetical protein EG327_011069 [Venturia inaequalis]|uniref:Uncharacterized protein n=1 Tax=Venturia inaequalis TaxID=5025 RepID=A0A8H3YSD9_VENIN|nr:hypothetical protein EG327_011069 [Venturia inaequalis]